MAKDKETPVAAPVEAPASTGADKYNQRKWSKPNDRAKSYAEDRKSKVHTYGPKKGQPLDEYEKGLRSGYLLCQSDHTGIFKYRLGMEAGMTKEEARDFSRSKSKEYPEKFAGKLKQLLEEKRKKGAA